MKEVDPETTNRAMSFKMFMNAPMPMVTVFRKLDITHLVRLSKRGYKLNMLMCYCIGRAAQAIAEFRLLPVKDRLCEYDRFGVNVIVANRNGGLSFCDLLVGNDLSDFNRSYLELTTKVRDTCEDFCLDDCMIIGTSAIVKYKIDGIVNMYDGIFNNPFVSWGKSEKHFFSHLTQCIVSVSPRADGWRACWAFS